MADLRGFDANTVEPNDSFDPLPNGDYLCVISSSEMKPTKAGDGSFLELEMEVIEGPFKGRKVWDRLNLNNANETAVKIAKGTLSAICRAVNVLTPTDSCELHDIPLTVKVVCKKRADTEEMTNVAAEKIAKALTPAELAEVVRKRTTDVLVDRAELTADQASKAMANLSDAEFLFELETVQLGDQPLIELKDGEDYKNTSSLSTGQKCTAILPILLLENENPLIIDQPEDNLDNRFIFQTVVESVARVKPKRQLILVTHNPNIPVLGDADHVVVLESDGARAKVTKSGNVDACKSEIVTLLEGGEEAFRKRGERYGQA